MSCNCSDTKPQECGRKICCGKCPDQDSCSLISKCNKCTSDKATDDDDKN